MNEQEWKSKRDLSKGMLQAILVNLQDVKDTGVLLGAESDYCQIVKFQIDSLLGYWNERSIVSRIRFVEGAENG